MIPADYITFDGDTAWLVIPAWPLPRSDEFGHDRPCDTCGGTTRIACPGISVEPKTKMGRDAAGLVMGRDYCYGMHMGHSCPDCSGTGRHTFDIEVEAPIRHYSGNDAEVVGVHYEPRTHRVAIVPGMVLPIVDNGQDMVAHYEHGCVLIVPHRETGELMTLYVKLGVGVEHIVLPSAAKPGTTWAVQLKVAS